MAQQPNQLLDFEDMKVLVKDHADIIGHDRTLATRELAEAITNAASDVREGLMAVAEAIREHGQS